MGGLNRKAKQKQRQNTKSPVIDPYIGEINARKIPKTKYKNEEVVGYDNLTPVWSFKRMQRESKWTFTAEDFVNNTGNGLDPQCVLSKLASFENMTWREIKQQTHGEKGKSSNHFVDISDLCKEARDRLMELQLTENIFSLRLDGKTRIYGVLQSRVLEILWYDPNHEIYPVKK